MVQRSYFVFADFAFFFLSFSCNYIRGALTLVLCIAAMLQVPLHEIGLNFHIKGHQIFLMFLATLTVIGVLISDIALAILDPRIRLQEARGT